MKSLFLIQATIIFSTLLIASCKKGEVGPQGPPGERGATGDSGPAGKNGGAIFSGSGIPANSQGSTGDYYLNIADATLYGPKTDAGWGKPMNLRGPRGATGAQGPKGDRGDAGPRGATGAQGPKGDTGDAGPRGATGDQGEAGSQILSGATSPTAAIGRLGDYYFHTATGALFGPKTNAGWGSGIVLRGVQGPKGDKGDKGDPGARGLKGDKGDTGTANVIYSEWIRAEWDFQNSRSRSLTINGIQALQNPEKSSVRLYMRFGVQNANYALPYTEFWNDGNVTTDYTFGQNYINARIIGTGMNIDPFQYNEIYFRYIIIPGGIAASAKTNRIDLNNLDAVSKAFNIPMM